MTVGWVGLREEATAEAPRVSDDVEEVLPRLAITDWFSTSDGAWLDARMEVVWAELVVFCLLPCL